jgi:hypothetical protein
MRTLVLSFSGDYTRHTGIMYGNTLSILTIYEKYIWPTYKTRSNKTGAPKSSCCFHRSSSPELGWLLFPPSALWSFGWACGVPVTDRWWHGLPRNIESNESTKLLQEIRFLASRSRAEVTYPAGTSSTGSTCTVTVARSSSDARRRKRERLAAATGLR